MSQVYPSPNYPSNYPSYDSASAQPGYNGIPPPYEPFQPKETWAYPSQTYSGGLVVPPSRAAVAPTPFVQNQVVVIDGAGVNQPVYYRATDSYAGPLVLSCFVIWFCNVLFGFIAFILAVLASNSAVVDRDGARRLGRASYIVSGTGIAVSCIIIVIVVGVVVGGAASAATSVVSTCNYYVNGICYTFREYNYYSYCFGYLASDGYCYYN